MPVDTRKVSDRREVHYESLDDLLADAERLATGEVRVLGNWSYGQILKHLAIAMNAAIDGTEMKVPWLLKKLFPLIMSKQKMMSQPMRPGFKIPKPGQAQFVPDASVSTEEGLAALRAAIDRFRSEPSRAPHPAFGELQLDEWDKLNLRHAEMHMSFAVPA